MNRRILLPVVTIVACLFAGTPAHAAGPAYTALGDSYSSGVGTREYYSDSGGCQRSQYAYPVIDAGRLGATLTFAACSGAKIPGIISGQLGSLNADTRYVSVTGGGNDIGWSSVIVQCAKPWPYTCWGQIDTAENYIRNTLPGQLNSLYAQIRTRSPNARVVAVGYPKLFNGVECNAIARISPGEQSRLNAAADLLATTTKARAEANGIVFVDSRSAFTGHAVCSSSEWINGTSWPLSESYHPNRNGQIGFANIIEPALRS